MVYCEFNDKGNTLLISTFFFYNKANFSITNYATFYTEHEEFSFPWQMIKTVMKSDKYTCSQNVKVTCYFQNAISYEFSRTHEEYFGEYYNERQVFKRSLILTKIVSPISHS